MVRFIGDPFIVHSESGLPLCSNRIATAFPFDSVIVTLPGIHATQGLAYIDEINCKRKQAGLEPLSAREREEILCQAVSLLLDGANVLIRPDPERMNLAFAADKMIQQLVPRTRIKFLFAYDPRVRQAIICRGEAWRIQPLPRSQKEMRRLIQGSLIAVRGEPIYYYCAVRGTRILTCEKFARLAPMSIENLRLHLAEIAELAGCRNSLGWPELVLFMTDGQLKVVDLVPTDLEALDETALKQAHSNACKRLYAATPKEFRNDDIDDDCWRNQMYRSLVAEDDDTLAEEELLGLGKEYFMQIHWLPGARIEEEQLIFDPDLAGSPDADPIAHELICNLIREYDGIEFVNIGHVVRSLSRRVDTGGRRGVYVAHFRASNSSVDELHIIRYQKWGVRERLDEGDSLMVAMRNSNDYTDYILDRRLACRQLGMKVAARLWVRQVQEKYSGVQQNLLSQTIWSPYIERDYIPGIATDKVPRARLNNPEYAIQLADGLGRAAATNLIVGRANPDGQVIFDDGDEIIVEDSNGMIQKIVVGDPTGSFKNYGTELSLDAPAYADPILRRLEFVPDRDAFQQAYLQAFIAQFQATQQRYDRNREAFDALFCHRPNDPGGNLAYRWALTLRRLERSDASALAEIISERVHSRQRS